jgi:hypothetical protein
MKRKHQGWLAGTVLAFGLGMPAPAFAGHLFGHDDCPPPFYSCLHYWAPTLYRCRAYHHTPQFLYAPNLEPCIAPHCRIQTFPCPPVPPAVSAADYPVPPIRPTPPGAETPETPERAPAETQAAESRSR